jgi:hypothetical protein
MKPTSTPLLRLQGAGDPLPPSDSWLASIGVPAHAALLAAAALLLLSASAVGIKGTGDGGAARSLPRAVWGVSGRMGLRRTDSEVCRLDYSVRTFEGELLPVCDIAKCVGRENITVLSNPAAKERRWSQGSEDALKGALKAKTMGGGLAVSMRGGRGESGRRAGLH